MRVATWNILHGSPIPPQITDGASPSLESTAAESSAAHIEEIASFISRSGFDLIGLQEIDDYQERSGSHSQIAVIAAHIGSKDFAYARTVIGTPGVAWRKLRKGEEVINPGDTQASYGIGLISKIPVTEWKTLQLGRSWIGLPLAVPGGKDGKSLRFIYVKDEPRIALAAHLSNGFTVIVTHLSFVPLVNLWQLFRIKRWAKKIHEDGAPEKILIIGDLNLPFNLPIKPKIFSEWQSLSAQKSYPAWRPSIQFDYILSLKKLSRDHFQEVSCDPSGYSDHLPVVVDL